MPCQERSWQYKFRDASSFQVQQIVPPQCIFIKTSPVPFSAPKKTTHLDQLRKILARNSVIWKLVKRITSMNAIEFLYELSAFVETLVQLEHWWFSKSSCVTSNRISCQISACEHGILNLNGEAACTLSTGSTRLKGGAQIVHIQQQQQQQEQSTKKKTANKNKKRQTANNKMKFHLFCTYDAKLEQLILLVLCYDMSPLKIPINTSPTSSQMQCPVSE